MNYADKRETVSAHTEPGANYPAYINVSVDGTHSVIVTVRGPRREDGSEGPTAAIRLSMTTFGDLVREWDEQHVEAGFSAARQVDLANKREDSPAE